MLKNETNFQLNLGSLLDTLIIWNHELLLHHVLSNNIPPKSEIRIEKHTKKKNDFNLTRSPLLLTKYKIITGRMYWVSGVGFDQMNLIFNKWHLFDFISMIRFWMHMIFEIGYLISEQERFTNREPWSDLQNHWHWLSLKSPAVRGYNVDFDGNTNNSTSAWEQRSISKQWFSEIHQRALANATQGNIA